MSTHNIYFRQEVRKIWILLCWKKAPYQKLWNIFISVVFLTLWTFFFKKIFCREGLTRFILPIWQFTWNVKHNFFLINSQKNRLICYHFVAKGLILLFSFLVSLVDNRSGFNWHAYKYRSWRFVRDQVLWKQSQWAIQRVSFYCLIHFTDTCVSQACRPFVSVKFLQCLIVKNNISTFIFK